MDEVFVNVERGILVNFCLTSGAVNTFTVLYMVWTSSCHFSWELLTHTEKCPDWYLFPLQVGGFRLDLLERSFRLWWFFMIWFIWAKKDSAKPRNLIFFFLWWWKFRLFVIWKIALVLWANLYLPYILVGFIFQSSF